MLNYSASSEMSETGFWAELRAAGPLDERASFDPYLTDDILAAERSIMQYDRRKSFVASYAWAVPSPEAIHLICEAVTGRTLLEICAGAGLWAKLLSEAGVPVVATDLSPPRLLHYPVERMEAEEAVKRHRECNALMLCWPPMKDDCAFHALQVFQGDLVVYVGDVRFTADQRFHESLKSEWELAGEICLATWPGISDSVYTYLRT